MTIDGHLRHCRSKKIIWDRNESSLVLFQKDKMLSDGDGCYRCQIYVIYFLISSISKMSVNCHNLYSTWFASFSTSLSLLLLAILNSCIYRLFLRTLFHNSFPLPCAATDVQKMGYGSRAVDLLISYFEGEFNDGSTDNLQKYDVK